MNKHILLLEQQVKNLQQENVVLRNDYMTVSIVLTYALALLSIYALIIGVMNHFEIRYQETIISSCFALGFFGAALFIMLLHTKQPLSLFGFNLNNYRKNSIEAVIYSILFCIVITFSKWYVTEKIPALHHLPIFDVGHLAHMGLFGKFHHVSTIILALIYILFVPLQALITYSAVQSPLIHFLHFHYAKLISIIIATLFFAALHVSVDFIYAVCMVIPGFFWAILYARQQSLVGVIISHIIVGVYALYILGYGAFFVALNRLLF